MKYIVILPAFVILLLSCTSKNSEKNPVADGGAANLEILPLEVGNDWVFKRSIFDESNNQTDSGFDTAFIIGDTIISSERWFVFKDNPEKVSVLPRMVFRNDSSGLQLFALDSIQGSPPKKYLIAKYPGIINDSFEVAIMYHRAFPLKIVAQPPPPPSVGPTYFLTLADTAKNLQTLMGERKCYEFDRGNGSWFVSNSFYCPGIGLIRYEEFVLSGTSYYQKAVYELVKFVLK